MKTFNLINSLIHLACWLIILCFYKLECYFLTSFIINFNKIYDVKIFTTYFNFVL